MRITSKIKTIFPVECMKLLAAVCDTRKIESDRKKMTTILQILSEYKLQYTLLGGATNRITVQIDGYAIKIAVNHQGFKDNFMEYSICQELQPFVTKAYETDGYLLVAECVYLMDITNWRNRKSDIIKILDILSQDYLLGDVGYIEKNITNWGIRDNGEIVILDYAYCHRATENLFTCEKCGEGILVYDTTYDHLMCGNRSVCNARYTYNERKRIQGDQVDLDMIEESKESSIIMKPGQIFDEAITVNDQIMDGSTIVVHNWWEYQAAKAKEEEMVSVMYDSTEMMDRLIEIQRVAMENPEEAKKMKEQLDKEIHSQAKGNSPTIIMADDYEGGNDDVWYPGRKMQLSAYESMFSMVDNDIYGDSSDSDSTGQAVVMDESDDEEEDDGSISTDDLIRAMMENNQVKQYNRKVNVEPAYPTDQTFRPKTDDVGASVVTASAQPDEGEPDSNKPEEPKPTGRSMLVNGKEL